MVNNIKLFRLQAGLTQAVLGEKARIHRPDIVKLELGQIKAYPKWRKRIAIALDEKEEVLFPND